MASGIITLHTDIPLDGNCLASYSLLCFCISMVTDPPIKHQWLLASLDQSNTGCRSVTANPLILRSQALDPGIPAQGQWDPSCCCCCWISPRGLIDPRWQTERLPTVCDQEILFTQRSPKPSGHHAEWKSEELQPLMLKPNVPTKFMYLYQIRMWWPNQNRMLFAARAVSPPRQSFSITFSDNLARKCAAFCQMHVGLIEYFAPEMFT